MLSTPKMIDFMEGVCKTCAEPAASGIHHVGYEVHVKHKAAAPIGTQIKVMVPKCLKLTAANLLFEFRVTAGDKVMVKGNTAER